MAKQEALFIRLVTLLLLLYPTEALCHPEAKAIVSSLETSEKDPFERYLAQASIYLDERNFAEAEHIINHALVTKPRNPRALSIKALIKFNQGKKDAAVKTLESIPAKDSERCEVARANQIIFKNEKSERERKSIENLINHCGPKTPELYLKLAATFKDEDNRGIATLDEAVKLLGPIITLQVEALRREELRGDHTAAVARIREILRSPVSKSYWNYRLGQALVHASQESAALNAFATAKESLTKERSSVVSPEEIEAGIAVAKGHSQK